jgi:sulfur-carrier protein
MRIRVRYFASLREAVGQEDEALDLPEGADVAAARLTLAARHPAIAPLLPRCIAAVNRAWVADTAALASGDELVFVPPLGGGAPCRP